MNKDGYFILKVILCFFLPPLAVYLHCKIDYHFWISVLLMLLGHIPSIIYSLFVISDSSIDTMKLGQDNNSLPPPQK